MPARPNLIVFHPNGSVDSVEHPVTKRGGLQFLSPTLIGIAIRDRRAPNTTELPLPRPPSISPSFRNPEFYLVWKPLQKITADRIIPSEACQDGNGNGSTIPEDSFSKLLPSPPIPLLGLLPEDSADLHSAIRRPVLPGRCRRSSRLPARSATTRFHPPRYLGVCSQSSAQEKDVTHEEEA